MPAKRLGDFLTDRDNGFNLIRMVAASGVILSHAYPLALGPGTPEPLEFILKGDNLGRLCVFVFFAISGFLIAASFDRRHSVGQFALARSLRIYPGLIVMLCLTLPLIGLIEGQPPGYWLALPARITDQVVMFVPVGPQGPSPYPVFAGNPYPNAFNGALWTLKYEVMCYIGVALAGMLGVLRHKTAALVCLAVAVAGNLVVPSVTQNWDVRMLSYLGLPFAFGTVAYVWRDRLILDGRVVMGMLAATALLWPTALFFAMMTCTVTYSVLWLGYVGLARFKSYNSVGVIRMASISTPFPCSKSLPGPDIPNPWVWRPQPLRSRCCLPCCRGIWLKNLPCG